MKPSTLGELRKSYRARTVKDEMRANLIGRLRENTPIFPGIIGYEDSVVPQVVNAILSRHNMILLGFEVRPKAEFSVDSSTFSMKLFPTVSGCEIHDSPFNPICHKCRSERPKWAMRFPFPG